MGITDGPTFRNAQGDWRTFPVRGEDYHMAAERAVRREQGVAGSYNHIVDNRGNLRESGESFTGMIENLGDAYEAIEELYGMVWWLAHHQVYGREPSTRRKKTDPIVTPSEMVEHARQEYQMGLAIARETPNKPASGS